MKKMLFVVLAVTFFALPALAQDTPKAELFLGYDYTRFVPALSGNPSFNMSGGGGAVTYNFSKYVGLKAEFTGVGTGDVIQNSAIQQTLKRSGNFFTYMFGPQVAIRNQSRVTPFVHLLFGGAYSNVYANLSAQGSISNGNNTADFGKHSFAMAFGGGLDVKAGKYIAIRLGQFDYFMTRFSGREVTPAGAGALDISNQSNFRYMAGINFLIGGSK